MTQAEMEVSRTSNQAMSQGLMSHDLTNSQQISSDAADPQKRHSTQFWA